MSLESLDSYKGRRVLVTGHTGFCGGWLSEWLLALDARVAGYSLAPEADRPSVYEMSGLARRMTSHIGDVCDLAALTDAIVSFRPSIIFHLAAQPLVRRAYRDPVGTYATNVMGTVNVLEAARMAGGVDAVVIVTTDKCYRNPEWVWPFRETDPVGGKEPYSASKACAEIVAAEFMDRIQSRPLVATARAGNVIGGGDWSEDRLVPDLVRAFSNGHPAILRNPDHVRPWQHVLEPLYGYLLLGNELSAGRASGSWNFGPPAQGALTVEALSRILAERLGGTVKVKRDPASPHEAGLLRIDSSKAEAQLGWRSQLNVTQTVEMTAEWYLSVLENPACASEMTWRQIDNYIQMLHARESGREPASLWATGHPPTALSERH